EILSYVRKSAARRSERSDLATLLAADDAQRAQADAARERLVADANTARYEEYQATMALDERTAARAETAGLVQTAAAADAAAQARSEDAERRCLDHARDARGAELAVEAARERIDTLVRELAASRERRDGALAAAERAAGTERASSREWESAYAALRAVEDRRAAAAADAAESDTASQAAAAQCERLVEHERRLAEESTATIALRDAARARVEELRRTGADLDKKIERLDTAASNAAAARSHRASTLEAERAALDAARARVVETNARLTAHNELDEAGAGVPAGVRAVAAAASSDLRGTVGVVSDLIEVDAKYATAIDVALGARAHDVVTRTSTDARTAIEFLKQRRAGRATFLPLDRARQRSLPLAPDASSAKGYVGKAVDLVRCANDARDAIEYLLGDVVIVGDLSAALALSSTAQTITVVTLAGEIVRGAAITGGSDAGDAGPIARRAQAAQLRTDLDTANADVEKAKARADAARVALEQASADIERATQERVDAELQRRDAIGSAAHVEDEVSAHETRAQSLAESIARAKTDLGNARADARRYEERAGAARAAAAKLVAERDAAASAADRLQAELSSLRDAHRTSAAEAAALVERVAQAGDDVEAARAH
ncbi:MAG TPA: hypothetical protein VFF43_09375, partial [Caldimonas sp.]|nr:hypothetical protein [Caldimonas sp.]